MTDVHEIRIDSSDDIVQIRKVVRTVAGDIRMSLVDQTKLVTAASELARNIVGYGGGGTVRIERLTGPSGVPGVRMVFEDSGPGIPDVELALTDGWSSGQGLGLGLPGARRLVDEFDLQTAAGRGTRVTVTKWTR
ncbi:MULTISPECIES: anti-sigma regulatory factor [Thermomonospora]|uniref:Serine/threonine-protein kinase RsbT n=1 Tax=Thermomonospora cellulosilytica TaxID=1411118 RepID=A0A7W3N248_9ACTN|nr:MULTISPECIES: anti-sigma regulatory factor [Thermomonospora]MBA9006173.1 serine/threonine-protein kinase RsbT [Thermomonospora cellulosilytica]